MLLRICEVCLGCVKCANKIKNKTYQLFCLDAGRLFSWLLANNSARLGTIRHPREARGLAVHRCSFLMACFVCFCSACCKDLVQPEVPRQGTGGFRDRWVVDFGGQKKRRRASYKNHKRFVDCSAMYGVLCRLFAFPPLGECPRPPSLGPSQSQRPGNSWDAGLGLIRQQRGLPSRLILLFAVLLA